MIAAEVSAADLKFLQALSKRVKELQTEKAALELWTC
jgi:hypothetical protein